MCVQRRSLQAITASRPGDRTVYDLLRRLTLSLISGTAATAETADHESSVRIDGAELTEMDCRWSPTMGLPQTAVEETQPHTQLQGPARS